ncbi:MAG TPA: hypothetical protein VFU69_13670 [Ktedonobacterales bacterium]|nr:hypothetical protein [Ktedonobacterales bacterium]
MSATLAPARPAAPAAPRSSVRARARTLRKHPRPPQPRIPEDFFSAEAHALLTRLLVERAERWQTDGAPPVFYYGRESEPVWGDLAQTRCSCTTLRRIGKHLLYDSLCMDLERGLRLFILPWTEERDEPGQTVEARRLALAGALWRVGQHYREIARRKGAEAAQHILRLAMDTLWW